MLRREDARLLTGEAKYTADLDIPGALHLAVAAQPVRPRPHQPASTSPARWRRPACVAAYTGADLQEQWATPMPCAWAVTEDMLNPPHFPRGRRHGQLRG